MKTKTCGSCKKEFPRTEDNFFTRLIKNKNKSGLAIYHSFRSDCKKCHGVKNMERKKKALCKKWGCDISDYYKMSDIQYSLKRTFDLKAKKILTDSQYSRYLKKQCFSTDDFLKDVKESKEIRNKRLSEIAKQTQKYFSDEDKRLALRGYAKNNCERLTDSYIANVVMKKPIKELSKEIIETKRLIIKLKRYLKNGK